MMTLMATVCQKRAHLDRALLARRLHAAGRVDCVAKDSELGQTRAQHAAHEAARVATDAQPAGREPGAKEHKNVKTGYACGKEGKQRMGEGDRFAAVNASAIDLLPVQSAKRVA